MHGSHDLLVAYQDGTANYLNYSGRAMAWEDSAAAQMQAAVSHCLAVAQVMAKAIGSWNEPSLPPLPAGHAQVMALTASGTTFWASARSSAFSRPDRRGIPQRARPSVMQLMVNSATADVSSVSDKA